MQPTSPPHKDLDDSRDESYFLGGGGARDVHCMLGVPIDIVTMDQVIEAISNAQTTRRSCFISTPNLNFIAILDRSPEFGVSLRCSDLSLVDGIAVMFGCKCLGIPVVERVAGSDIIDAVLASDRFVQNDPLRVFFFGGTEEAGRKACLALNCLQPDKVVCVGHLSPGFGSVEEMSTDEIIASVNAARPDFVIVSLGAEKGQSWIMRNRSALEAPIVSHLGATINFFAGSVRRAPKLWQKIGLEWVWRIREEPQLATRYWNDGRTLLRLLLTKVVPLAVSLRWNSWRWRNEKFMAEVEQIDTASPCIVVTGPIVNSSLNEFCRVIEKASHRKEVLHLDLSNAKWIDTSAMGTLLVISQVLLERGCSLQIIRATQAIKTALKLNGLGDTFGPQH